MAARRSVVLGGAASLAAILGTGCATLGRTREPPPVILVHGAWHGSWCWEPVATLLTQAGHAVYMPTLTGLGRRSDEMSASIGLETHIADVASLFERRGLRNVVLVGHSYGGMIVTAIADRFKSAIGHVLYLDAALPENGDSMASYDPNATPQSIAATKAALTALAPDGVAMQPLPPEVFGIPPDHPRYAWVAERLTPHPLKTWFDPVTLTDGGSDGLPRTYIHCTDPVLPNAAFPAIAALVRDDPTWDYYEMQTGHDAMITAPVELADNIRMVAGTLPIVLT